MKAHIDRQPRSVLLWNFGPAQAGYTEVERVARAFGAKVYCVTTDDLYTTVGNLCAGRRLMRAVAPEEGAAFVLPAMIVSGIAMENGDLNAFVDAVKARVDIPIRAAVTPTSKNWTLGELLTELNQEHDAHQAMDGEA